MFYLDHRLENLKLLKRVQIALLEKFTNEICVSKMQQISIFELSSLNIGVSQNPAPRDFEETALW